ncbi:hypothetical protein A9Q84_10535 [Halobacteriovorax marinus]|uniref:PilZ domain-containing protein n=1 Tax=Halobacteriovorax marinus TaxID=97084 RepID=A0A1Y5FCU2_9BACT|nr:hypothetical protein A9Q84_10535 [Halobacteriovorax marinus]
MLDMIYNNSTDPVYIKKISLKIWALRDELKAVIRERMKTSKDENLSIDDLILEYRSKTDVADGGGEVQAIGDLNTGEDEMAAAIAGDAPEEAAAEGDTEGSADDMAAAMLEGQTGDDDDNTISITQRYPTLVEEEVSNGTTILAEIGMDRLFFFSNKPFLTGESIVIEFVIPKRFVLNANILFCREYNMKSRIISKNRLPYRIGADFSFLKEGERTLLRQFINSIEPDIPEAPVKTDSKPQDDDEDFDELDDLDL